LDALRIRLDPDELRRLEEAFPLGAAAGERYNPQAMQALNL